MREQSSQPAQLTSDQIGELRRVCERLAYIARGSLPPELDNVDDVLKTLSQLTDMCGRQIARTRKSAPRKQRSELEDIEHLKARFIRNVSHELRTPLACIDGFARALLQMERNGSNAAVTQSLSASREQFLSIISQEAQRLGKMVEDVLDLAEIESQRRKRNPVVNTARELFDVALSSLATTHSFAEVTFQMNPAETGPNVFADREHLIDVLRELLYNSHKFSGGQKIVLGAEQVSIGPDRITQASESGLINRVTTATQLFVRDKGIGISKSELSRVFEKFYRGQDAAALPGTGLGLSIVRALVAQNGGHVWCDSVRGRGSTFYVILPNEPHEP